MANRPSAIEAQPTRDLRRKPAPKGFDLPMLRIAHPSENAAKTRIS